VGGKGDNGLGVVRVAEWWERGSIRSGRSAEEWEELTRKQSCAVVKVNREGARMQEPNRKKTNCEREREVITPMGAGD